MPDRLGHHQIEALAAVCRVRCIGLAPRREERALIKRGLLRTDDSGAYCITPSGLRALADAMDAGRINDGLETWRKNASEQRDA